MFRTPMHNRFAEGFVEEFSSGDVIDPFSARILDRATLERESETAGSDWLDRDLDSIHRAARDARAAALSGWLDEIGAAVSRLFHSVVDAVRVRRAKLRAAEELYRLDRETLRDLGLNRSDIPFILNGWTLDRDARPSLPKLISPANNNHQGRDAA